MKEGDGFELEGQLVAGLFEEALDLVEGDLEVLGGADRLVFNFPEIDHDFTEGGKLFISLIRFLTRVGCLAMVLDDEANLHDDQ